MAQPNSQPTYNIDDIVYIKASAARGWLESYVVDGIYFNPTASQWVYQINIARSASTPVIVGDHVQLAQPRILYFKQGELTDYDTALRVARTFHQASLDRLDSLIGDTTEG